MAETRTIPFLSKGFEYSPISKINGFEAEEIGLIAIAY